MRMQLLDPGGAANVVYSVAMPERTSPVPTGKQDSLPAAATAAPPLGSSALGKLEIKWRSTLGGTGRLQTQQIQAPSPITKVCTVLVEAGHASLRLARGAFSRLSCCLQAHSASLLPHRQHHAASALLSASAVLQRGC